MRTLNGGYVKFADALFKRKQDYMTNHALLKSGRRERTTFSRIEKYIYPEPNTGCWLWSGAVNDYGYGNTKKMTIDGYTLRGAHRVMYYLIHGRFDYSLYVCHSCDNTFCVNPDHLFLGTTQDNSEDMRIKGRAARGINRPNAKLDDSKVREIKGKYKTGKYTYRGLTQEYNCHGVKDILLGKTWTHVKWA